MCNFFTMSTAKCTEKRNDGAQTLSELDDVHLRRVFTYLHLRDLCNTAKVCKRFKAIAEDVFKTVYAAKPVDVLKLIEGDKRFHKDWFMVRSLTETFFKFAREFFRIFGPFITSLWLTGTAEKGGMDENQLLALVKAYCSALKELTLDGVGNNGMCDNFGIELLPLFSSLQKLRICNRFGDDVCDGFAALFSDCHNLTHLSLNGVPATMWLNAKFPKLETLIVLDGWEFDYSEFEPFLKNHEHLRVLRYEEDSIFSGLFQTISTTAIQLEEFYCNFGDIDDICDEDNEVDENVLQLAKLKSLKRLQFTCDATCRWHSLIAAFEKEETPLEYLEIVDCEIDSEVIFGVSKLKTMKTLKLIRCQMTAETLGCIHQHLKKLDKVIIEDINSNVNDIKIAPKSAKRSTEGRELKNPKDAVTILEALNDDCLMEIFKSLTVRDLCNVADVCKDFRRNAQTVFHLQHSKFKTRNISEENGTNMITAEQLFRNFGEFIQELCIDGGHLYNIADQENLMYLACEYCRYTKLKVLTLAQIVINVELRWIYVYFNLFYALPELRLHSCTLNDDFGKFISTCEIPRIVVFSPYELMKWMNHTFPNLLSFSLIDAWISESHFEEFIKRNGHLLQLLIHKSILSSDIIKTVTESMPNLVSFCLAGIHVRIPNERKNVLRLAKLRSLKALTLDCGLFPLKELVDALVTESTPLSEFNIYFGNVDKELLKKLNDITTPLTNLTLRRVQMQNVSLIDVVKTLTNLQELEIDIKRIVAEDVVKMLPFAEKLTKFTVGSERSNVQIDISTYQSILRIVKNREKYNKLYICINSDKQHVFVPKQMLQESSYWLEIENPILVNLLYNLTDSEDEQMEVSSSSHEGSFVSYDASEEEESEESLEEEEPGESLGEESAEEESVKEESAQEQSSEDSSEEMLADEKLTGEESSHEDDSSRQFAIGSSPRESIDESSEDTCGADVDTDAI